MSASVEISSYQGTIPMSDYREKINKKRSFSCLVVALLKKVSQSFQALAQKTTLNEQLSKTHQQGFVVCENLLYKLQRCRDRDLFVSQISVTKGGFEMRISCIKKSSLTHYAIRLHGLVG